jgi:hypothetical protein
MLKTTEMGDNLTPYETKKQLDNFKWSAGFPISICLADKYFSKIPHKAQLQTVI